MRRQSLDVCCTLHLSGNCNCNVFCGMCLEVTEETKMNLALTGFEERMAREQLAIQRAEKLVEKHEALKRMYDEINRLLEESREKKRYREMKKKRKELRKQKQKLYNMKRMAEKEEEVRLAGIERELLAMGELECEKRRTQKQKELEEAKQESVLSVKGKKPGKKTERKGKTDLKAKGKKGKKSKESLKKRKSIDIEALRNAFQKNCAMNREIINDYDGVVMREEAYEDAYWRNIDYFDWDVSSSVSSSDSDAEARDFPLTVKSRKLREKTTRQKYKCHEEELKRSLEEKLTSLGILKDTMWATRKTYYCHKEERERREENRKRRLENQLRVEFKIEVKDLPQNSRVVDKFRRMREQKNETEMRQLEKHIEIIEKLLREEQLKHPVTSTVRAQVAPRRNRVSDAGGDLVEVDDVLEESAEDEESPQELSDALVKSSPRLSLEKDLPQLQEDDSEGEKKTKKKKAKKGSKGSKEKVGKKEKKGSKSKKGKKSKEIIEELPPPPPPLKRYRISAENLSLELVKNFVEADDLDAKYLAHDLSANKQLPVETAFSWKPRVVLFKDFRADAEYTRKIQINNLRCAARLACRFRRIEYATTDFAADPLVLQVLATEVQRVCPGLGFTIDVLFTPSQTTSSFAADLVFETEREEGLHQFRIPVQCTVETSDVKISPQEVYFPKSPCWSDGKYGVALQKTVTVVNNGRRPCVLSIKSVKDSVDGKHGSGAEPKENETDDEIDYVLDQMDLSVDGDEERCVEYLKNLFECKQSSDTHNKCDDERVCSVVTGWDEVGPTWGIENLQAVLACREAVQECIDNVFRVFRFERKYCVDIPGESTTRLKLRYSTDRPGVYEDSFTFLFRDQDDDSVVAELLLPVRAESTALPVTIGPAHCDLRVCMTDCDVRQAAFCVRNAGKMPCTVVPRVPPSLRAHATPSPAAIIVQPGHAHSFRVRFAPGGMIRADAVQYWDKQDKHLLRFPVVARIQGSAYGKCPPLRVYISARVTSAFDLALHPARVDLGRVSTLETVTSTFKMTNNTLADHDYGFLSLPKCLMIQPGYGFGRINAGETRILQLLFSPSPSDVEGNPAGAAGREGNYETKIIVTTLACLGGAYKGNRERILEQVIAKRLKSDASLRSIAGSYAMDVSMKSDYSSDVWSETVDAQSTASETGTLGDDATRHLLEILADDDDHVLPGAVEKEVGGTGLSMRNLYAEDMDDVTIYGRLDRLVDTRTLKSEMGVRALVYDPLCELSSTIITLPATPCGSFSTARLHLTAVNRATETECYCGLLARDEDFRAAFEFRSPCDEIAFAPCSGEIEAGGEISVTVVFRPKLPEEQVRDTARQIRRERRSKSPPLPRRQTSVTSETSVDVEDVDWFPAEKSLLQVMQPYCTRTTVTCVIDLSAPGFTGTRRDLVKVVLVCPVVKPALVLLSDCQRLNFGPVALGTRPKKHLQVLNISSKHVHVKTSPLNPIGPLFCPTPLTPRLEPEHTMVLPVTFAPDNSDTVEEYMEVSSGLTVTPLIVTGRGVEPEFDFTPDFRIYRFETKSGKALDCKISIDNKCEAPLPFKIELLSVKQAVAVKSDESVGKGGKGGKGKGKGKEKKEKGAKPNQMALELSPEDQKELDEKFIDFESDHKAGLFVVRDVNLNGEITVLPFEKKVFNIQFNPPKLSGGSKSKAGSVSGKGKKGKKDKASPASSLKDVAAGEKKGKTKGKSSPATSLKDVPTEGKKGKAKGKSSPASSLKDVPAARKKGRKPSPATSLKNVLRGPQKFVARFRVALGNIVEVRELVLIGSVKEGKRGKRGK